MKSNEEQDGIQRPLTKKQTASVWVSLIVAAIAGLAVLGFAVKGFIDWIGK